MTEWAWIDLSYPSLPLPDTVALPVHTHETGLVSVAAHVGGHLIRLFVDTGATHTVLDPTTAERLALASAPGEEPFYTMHAVGPPAPVVVGPLALGTIILPQWPFPIVNIAFMNERSTVRADGVLGIDVLRQCGARFDVGAGVLHLSEPDDGAPTT